MDDGIRIRGLQGHNLRLVRVADPVAACAVEAGRTLSHRSERGGMLEASPIAGP